MAVHDRILQFYLATFYKMSNGKADFFPGTSHLIGLSTVQAIRNITFTNSRQFVHIFSMFYQKLRIPCKKCTYKFAYEFVYEIKTKEKISIVKIREISEIRAQI